MKAFRAPTILWKTRKGMETRPEIQEEELSGLWVENAADALGPAWTLQESQLSQREAARPLRVGTWCGL